jgi:hypothetical protein
MVSSDTLIRAADAYGQRNAATSSAAPMKLTDAQRSAEVDPNQSEDGYEQLIEDRLLQRDYDGLEQEARDARANKTRFKGGVWKLFAFYEALSKPTIASATDQDWELHLSSAQYWVAARPDSSTARIALAVSYEAYGNLARGNGFASTVSDDGWRLYNDRYNMAAATLLEATNLKERSPAWFDAMIEVALAQGWDKATTKKLVEDSFGFEPDYFHVYREYANYLLPKWYGNPGETEAFGQEIADRVGGQEGDFLYFEVASVAMCQCTSTESHVQSLSWPRIKDGYAALGKLYGYSNLRMNRFASMAEQEHDAAAAQPVFQSIGDNWEPEVWGSKQRFTAAKSWAQSQPL